jgi:hypothetical protein
MKIKNLMALLAAAGLAWSARAAETNATLSAAVQALTDSTNYSWSTTSEMANSPFPAMTTKGKTEQAGFTLFSAEGPNGEIQAVKKGGKGVIKTEDGWQTAEEFRQNNQGGPGPGRGFAGRLLSAPTPAEDAGELLKGIVNIKAGADGVFSADLTEQAAKDEAGFFGRRGRSGQGAPGGFTPPEPKDAKGTVKFWVKNGVLSKIELNTSAKITFQDEDHDMDRTTTTEISDVDSTKLDVPAEAKNKL